jgi:hypothetical protein
MKRDTRKLEVCMLSKKMQQRKVQQTMHEFKHGTLHSGSKTGPKVKDRSQAVAIALSQARKSK